MEKLGVILFLSAMAVQSVLTLPMMRTAPTECPLENGNLIDVHLFITDEGACRQLCQDDEKCIFYHYYKGSKEPKEARSEGEEEEDEEEGAEKVENQPSQCFLYDGCSRSVREATDDCPLTKENTVRVEAFVTNEVDCKTSCSDNYLCGYFKHFPSNDTRQPLMCYHLRKCSPRVIRRSSCPLERNNYIDHYLFTKTPEDCKQKCQDHSECRFYFWHPIDYSPAPLYCYIYRSCQGGSDELRIGFAIAGRHPGHYFLGEQVSADEVRGGAVCQKKFDVSMTEAASRGAAVAEYVGKEVLVCGGRIKDAQVDEVRSDCLAYKPRTGEWYEHSKTLEPREEASSAIASGNMYVLGGIVEGKITNSSEVFEMEDNNGTQWLEGPTLPEPRSRSCSVAVDGVTIAILGGETESSPTSADVKFYNLEEKEWTAKADMLVRRKDHACTIVTLGEERGILVSGGVSDDDLLLDSVEFYSFDNESWNEIAHLKQPRTEHGMAVISGLPTVIGGVSDFEFLSSIEVLDNSADESSPYGMEWRLAAYTMSSPRYDFAMATIPISAFKMNQRALTECPATEEAVVES